MSNPIRVLIVEDSVVQRKILRMALENSEGIDVIGHASNGRLALDRIALGEVDVITLDLEMPIMGGLQVLEELKGKEPKIGAIVVSALSQQGARATLEAMRLGAFDLITKPSSGAEINDVIRDLKQQLVPRILACGEYVANLKRAKARPGPTPAAPLPGATRSRRRTRQPAPTQTSGASHPVSAGARGSSGRGKERSSPEIIVLGCSTGGPQALDKVLPALPGDTPIPMLIVQHMPPMFTKTLAESLDRKCALRVMEAEDGQEARAGEVLIAPGGHHMRLIRKNNRLVVQISDDPPERSCRPSVDYLFRSAAGVTGGKTIAVVLTGMGDDGTAGARLLQPRGARIIAQDEASSVVFGMPRLLVLEGIADTVLPLDMIATEITHASRSGVKA